MDLFRQGNRCRFRLADVICPDQQQVVTQITPEMEVTGEIAFLSDGGERPNYFAIVEVKGIFSPLIVPVACLQPVREPEREDVGHGSENRHAGREEPASPKMIP